MISSFYSFFLIIYFTLIYFSFCDFSTSTSKANILFEVFVFKILKTICSIFSFTITTLIRTAVYRLLEVKSYSLKWQAALHLYWGLTCTKMVVKGYFWWNRWVGDSDGITCDGGEVEKDVVHTSWESSIPA